MKKELIVLGGLVALMLLSFAPPQGNKIVRLKNGNYELQNLKIEKDDVEKLQELADEMSQWFVENDMDNEKNKQDSDRTKYQDLITVLEQKEGFKQYIGAGWDDYFTIVAKEVYENAVSETLYHDKEEKKEFKAEMQQKVDAIMQSYLK